MNKPYAARTDGILLNRNLAISDAIALIEGRLRLDLHPEAKARCAASHERLQKVIDEDRHVYGLTTGFGPLANRLVDKASGAELQQNLVHHLATGVGPPFDWKSSRAMVLARLMSILQGVSGASNMAINALIALMNSDLSPVIPSKGTVGASGDLTPLAHMVLCFQGRGSFRDEAGRIYEGSAGLEKLGIAAIDLKRRDGLALVNGTSAMTGVAVLNADRCNRAVAWAIALTAGMAETQKGRIEAWHPAFGQVRPHPRQADAAHILRARVGDSARVVHTHLAARRLTDVGHVTEEHAGQDAYTLRCAPQVIGAVWDTLDWHNTVVTTELSSATDNPIFLPADEVAAIALHGGNFMGQHIGLASDAMANGVCVLAGLAERQVARLTDELLNRGLPAFLHQGRPGLNSGLMGAQVTASALLAEMRSVGPASVQSISTNGANQDVVSMGTIAARALQAKLDDLFHIQAILAMSVAQAIDIIKAEVADTTFSQSALAVRDYVRAKSDALMTDRPLGHEISGLARAMAQDEPPAGRESGV